MEKLHGQSCLRLSIFTQKMSLHFLYFYLNEKELNQQACLIKYVENEISNSTSHKKKREREKQKHNPTPKTFLKHLKFLTSYSNY